MRYQYKIPSIPPSNNKYQGNGSLGKNFEYQAEKQTWAELIFYNTFPRPPYPLARAKVTLHYFFKDKRRRDPDNYSGKFILDGLVKAGILQVDSFSVIELELKASVDPLRRGYTEITIDIANGEKVEKK